MSRFKYLLDKNENTNLDEVKLVGLFPFNTLVDVNSTDPSIGKLGFLDTALASLEVLARKNYSVILFINQFKNKQLHNESFQSMNRTIEGIVSKHGLKVAGLYWCPGVDKNDPFVVPNAGMFSKVTENQGVAWKDIPVLSTFDADLKAAEKAGATSIKIGKGAGKWPQFNTIAEWVETI